MDASLEQLALLEHAGAAGLMELAPVVRSKREAMQIDLWSIDPADWESAEWRLETTIYRRGGSFYRDGDSFHPFGAIVVVAAGVQHIFIHIGHPNGPAGSFRLTRTLDTPRLVQLLGAP